MKTKLTLSIEKQVIEEARALLKDERQNLSKTFENYLRQLISLKKRRKKNYPEGEQEILPEVAEMAGIFKTDHPTDPEEVKWEYFRDKYRLDD